MSLPSGIATCILTAGATGDFFGNDGTIRLEVTPVLGGNGQEITWTATGQTLVADTAGANAGAGASASIVVPAVNQSGFIDSNNQATTMWAYRCVITVTVGGVTKTWTKNVQPLVSQATVDLDLVPDGVITGPTGAPFPPVISVNGQTGIVVISGGGGSGGAVSSVAGRTGDVVLTKSDVGLANAANTTDLAKPISTATQAALDLTVHQGGAETVSGVKTFTASPTVPTPTTALQVPNKAYVDSVTGAGAADATTTTKGIVQLAGDLGGTAAAPTVPTKLTKSSNLSDLTSAATARTNLGLGSAATQATTAFDAAGVSAADIAALATIASTGSANDLSSGKVGLARIASGSTIKCFWNGTGWEYPVGTVVSARPSSRNDITFEFIDSAGTATLPSFALAGVDLLIQGGGGASLLVGNALSELTSTAATARQNLGIGTNVQPAAHGLLAWTFDPIAGVFSSGVGTAGVLHLCRLYTPSAISVTKAWSQVVTAGAGLTNVGFGLWSATGALLKSMVNANGATAAAFQSTGSKQVTFASAQALAAGTDFYVGFWMTGTTMPVLVRATNSFVSNINLAPPSLRFAIADTGLTTTAPAPFGTQTDPVAAWWMGVS